MAFLPEAYYLHRPHSGGLDFIGQKNVWDENYLVHLQLSQASIILIFSFVFLRLGACEKGSHGESSPHFTISSSEILMPNRKSKHFREAVPRSRRRGLLWFVNLEI
jgi:hypothetical protein